MNMRSLMHRAEKTKISSWKRYLNQDTTVGYQLLGVWMILEEKKSPGAFYWDFFFTTFLDFTKSLKKQISFE